MKRTSSALPIIWMTLPVRDSRQQRIWRGVHGSSARMKPKGVAVANEAIVELGIYEALEELTRCW